MPHHSDGLLRERGRVASLTRSRAADDVELVEARQRLRGEAAASRLRRILAADPPLTEDQRLALVRILMGAA